MILVHAQVGKTVDISQELYIVGTPHLLLALPSSQISRLQLEAELKVTQMYLGLNPSPAFISYMMIGKLLSSSGPTFLLCKMIPNKFGQLKQDVFVNL